MDSVLSLYCASRSGSRICLPAVSRRPRESTFLGFCPVGSNGLRLFVKAKSRRSCGTLALGAAAVVVVVAAARAFGPRGRVAASTIRSSSSSESPTALGADVGVDVGADVGAVAGAAAGADVDAVASAAACRAEAFRCSATALKVFCCVSVSRSCKGVSVDERGGALLSGSSEAPLRLKCRQPLGGGSFAVDLPLRELLSRAAGRLRSWTKRSLTSRVVSVGAL